VNELRKEEKRLFGSAFDDQYRIRALAIHPKLQGKGLGKVMVQTMMKEVSSSLLFPRNATDPLNNPTQAQEHDRLLLLGTSRANVGVSSHAVNLL
jgi:GNAT superfamily N-acetyltransferase